MGQCGTLCTTSLALRDRFPTSSSCSHVPFQQCHPSSRGSTFPAGLRPGLAAGPQRLPAQNNSGGVSLRCLLGTFIAQQLQLHIVQSIAMSNSAAATTDRCASTGVRAQHSPRAAESRRCEHRTLLGLPAPGAAQDTPSQPSLGHRGVSSRDRSSSTLHRPPHSYNPWDPTPAQPELRGSAAGTSPSPSAQPPVQPPCPSVTPWHYK